MASSPVQQAFVLWLVAIAAGLFETFVIIFASDESAANLAAGATVRFAVFGIAVYLAMKMRDGKNWARIALTILLGLIGLISLLIGPVMWLADGNTWSDLDLSASETLFAISRVVHVIAVVLAVILMYVPDANRWFRDIPAPASLRSP